MKMRRRLILGAAVLTALLRASAHDSPGDVIHLLTDRIESHGPTVRLLASRAYEHRSLGDSAAAIADFQHALKLQPGYSPAILGCAETMLGQGSYSDAESIIRTGLLPDDEVSRRAPFEAVLARILAAQLRWSEAREAWRAALQAPDPEVDWFLGEAECLARMGCFPEQVDALAKAVKRNPSVVLQRAWIRALVDAGEFGRASTEIESALAGSRWKSQWLLLRARINGQRGNVIAEKSDAMAALTEIRSRYNPERPAPYLVAEMGNALALLGQHEESRACIEQARRLGVPESLIIRSGG